MLDKFQNSENLFNLRFPTQVKKILIPFSSISQPHRNNNPPPTIGASL